MSAAWWAVRVAAVYYLATTAIGVAFVLASGGGVSDIAEVAASLLYFGWLTLGLYLFILVRVHRRPDLRDNFRTIAVLLSPLINLLFLLPLLFSLQASSLVLLAIAVLTGVLVPPPPSNARPR